MQEAVVDLLQSIVEIVTYGDRQDPMIFEYGLWSILCWYGFLWCKFLTFVMFCGKIVQMLHGVPGFSRICPHTRGQ